MNFLLVIFPFAAAFLLYLPLSARLSFPQYVHEEDSTERERFSNHAFAVLLARRIELYATVTSVAAVVVSLFVFRDPAFAGSVRINLIISIIAVALALLAVVFRHSVDTLVVRLMALERCIIIVILSCCEDEDDASAMSAFALFAIEELFFAPHAAQAAVGFLQSACYRRSVQRDLRGRHHRSFQPFPLSLLRLSAKHPQPPQELFCPKPAGLPDAFRPF